MSKEKYAHEKQEKYSVDPAFFDQQKRPFQFYNKKEGTFLGRDSKSWGKKLSKCFKIVKKNLELFTSEISNRKLLPKEKFINSRNGCAFLKWICVWLCECVKKKCPRNV